mmetsp:Transcript_34615/g.84777  ORF Transcript_34615/g.84777 Transcript_34615/m.84777 type:complete len:84 (-) Transcript_34615:34-285(-)
MTQLTEDPSLSIEDAISRLVMMAPPMGDARPDLAFVISLILATPASFEAVPASGSGKRKATVEADTGGSDIFKARQAQKAKRG